MDSHATETKLTCSEYSGAKSVLPKLRELLSGRREFLE